MTLPAARTAAKQYRGQLLLVGLDPIEQRNAERASRAAAEAKVMTFDECRDAYIASHVTGWRNAAHRQQWSSTLATYATPVFGHVPVDAVDTGLVVELLEPIWTEKNETASRVRGRIEAILDWARVRGYRNGPNPAMWKGHLDHLLPAKSKVAKIEHHPALPYARVGEFMADLSKRDGTAARKLRFTVLTAARRRSVRHDMGRSRPHRKAMDDARRSHEGRTPAPRSPARAAGDRMKRETGEKIIAAMKKWMGCLMSYTSPLGR